MDCCSLYVHVPYCRKKCDYCDFFSVVPEFPGEEERAGTFSSFAGLLLEEAAFRADIFGVRRWQTVYIGGGTPSLLPPETLYRLVRGLLETRPAVCGAEITVEANPDSLTGEWLEAASCAGVNRLSLGIQALDDAVLKASGRLCTRSACLDALRLVSDRWRGKFSADLIAGLPGQEEAGFLRGIRELTGFSPGHVSLYSLIVEDGTPLCRRIKRGQCEWDSDNADSLWFAGCRELEEAGYCRYEVSNFARPGYESAHNMRYWDMESYIGIGPGATGTVYREDLPRRTDSCYALRRTNPADIRTWTLCPCADGETEYIGRSTLMFEYLMMGFRKTAGVSRSAFQRRFGCCLETLIGPVFDRWKARGDAEERAVRGTGGKSPDRLYALTRQGLPFLNVFLEQIYDCIPSE